MPPNSSQTTTSSTLNVVLTYWVSVLHLLMSWYATTGTPKHYSRCNSWWTRQNFIKSSPPIYNILYICSRHASVNFTYSPVSQQYKLSNCVFKKKVWIWLLQVFSEGFDKIEGYFPKIYNLFSAKITDQ